MKFKLAISAMLMATVSPIAMSQDQGLMPDAIPGGDQFEVNCLALIPGGDQFQNAIRQIDDELPEGIPGGDQFDRKAIPGGDQFEPYQIPGGDQFVRSCFEGFQDVGLLIPGGDQFDPQALERLALGEFELSPALIEQGVRMDRTAVQQIANGGGLGFDGFIRPNPNLSALVGEDLIPGGDQFGSSVPTLDPLRMGDDEDIEIVGMNGPETPIIMPNQPDGDVVPVPVPAGCDWTGSWSSTYGILKLVQDGNLVSGDYSTKGFIEGTVSPGCNLKGTFDNRQEQIKGTYEFTRDEETFEGLWGLEGELPHEAWKGRRSSSELPVLRADERWTAACQWTGTWFTPTAGVRMRLVQDGARVSGEIGDNLIVEGTTDTACEGRRDIRMEATVTDRETGADQSMTITMSSGGQRYTGSLGGVQQGLPVSSVFSGSRASRDKPIIREQVSPISDAGGAVQRAGEDAEEGTAQDTTQSPSPSSQQNIARFEVNVGALCYKSRPRDERPGTFGLAPSILPVFGVQTQGIAWVRARIYNKNTREEVELAPIGGFPNINGDKERAWEVRIGDPLRTGDHAVAADGCSAFSPSGFAYQDRFGASEENPAGITSEPPLTFVFEIDPERFGYKDLDELLKRRRNRFRVVYKFQAGDRYANIYEFGEKARSHAMEDANFCGTCKMDNFPVEEVTGIRQPLGNFNPTGDGALTGFRRDGAEAFVLYDIKRLD